MANYEHVIEKVSGVVDAAMGQDGITFEQAQRKAKYGHRDWIYWRDDAGFPHAAPESAAVLKQAMLDCGFKRPFIRLCANDGIPFKMTWPLAIIGWRNARFYGR